MINTVHGITWLNEQSLSSLDERQRLIALLSMLGIKSATALFPPLAYYDPVSGHIRITVDGGTWMTMSGAI